MVFLVQFITFYLVSIDKVDLVFSCMRDPLFTVLSWTGPTSHGPGLGAVALPATLVCPPLNVRQPLYVRMCGSNVTEISS